MRFPVALALARLLYCSLARVFFILLLVFPPSLVLQELAHVQLKAKVAATAMGIV